MEKALGNIEYIEKDFARKIAAYLQSTAKVLEILKQVQDDIWLSSAFWESNAKVPATTSFPGEESRILPEGRRI